eukprot:CAMPEP_0117647906 /NCGR_PEP_ID=MMETSP0804-20121206/99_1 /TAXON_ID=1074897 /ORGANISM="Tetraselmis astigmatica, Strain CCMP880" /LENGTH=103 /DNA_ID=CAMNT_0005453429 /DNA_START=473 /DNA_END=784 /DNA_ORIENTATION=+
MASYSSTLISRVTWSGGTSYDEGDLGESDVKEAPPSAAVAVAFLRSRTPPLPTAPSFPTERGRRGRLPNLEQRGAWPLACCATILDAIIIPANRIAVVDRGRQ